MNYEQWCKLSANDFKGDFDPFEAVDQYSKDTINNIKNNKFLSEFEKCVKEHFENNNLNLCYETLSSDICSYI